MIYPIRAYGDPVLRKVCKDVDVEDPAVAELIEDMYKTMDSSNGVGLAAPQIGKDIRIFVIDSRPMYEEDNKGVRRAFINAEMLEEFDDAWTYEEGCLSIPHIRENVDRNSSIELRFQELNGEWKEETFDGMTARVIQHEYDHIEGILFVDHISALKRRLLKGKLTDISKGKVNIDYRMKFPKKK